MSGGDREKYQNYLHNIIIKTYSYITLKHIIIYLINNRNLIIFIGYFPSCLPLLPTSGNH